ncbi:MAG: hypothetical protein WAM14_19370 [Candidatus Nitrosopolaris sp.]
MPDAASQDPQKLVDVLEKIDGLDLPLQKLEGTYQTETGGKRHSST